MFRITLTHPQIQIIAPNTQFKAGDWRSTTMFSREFSVEMCVEIFIFIVRTKLWDHSADHNDIFRRNGEVSIFSYTLLREAIKEIAKSQTKSRENDLLCIGAWNFFSHHSTSNCHFNESQIFHLIPSESWGIFSADWHDWWLHFTLLWIKNS
jgi:hypothetical protein